MDVIQYHSQPATRQDEWVIAKTQGKRGGYFVEIGAHDGIRHSNTLTLERDFGWSGSLVEANPELHRRLVRNRSMMRCVRAAVGECNEGRVRFLLGDSYGGLSRHMPNDWLQEHELRKTPDLWVSTLCLRDVLLHECNAPRHIDYLSIDVEGAEYSILKSFFEYQAQTERRYTIDLITVEFRYDKMLLEKFEELMWPTHRLDEVRAFDACFVRQNEG